MRCCAALAIGMAMLLATNIASAGTAPWCSSRMLPPLLVVYASSRLPAWRATMLTVVGRTTSNFTRKSPTAGEDGERAQCERHEGNDLGRGHLGDGDPEAQHQGVEDERAGESGQRAVIQVGLRLVVALPAGNQRDGRRIVVMRDGNLA